MKKSKVIALLFVFITLLVSCEKNGNILPENSLSVQNVKNSECRPDVKSSDDEETLRLVAKGDVLYIERVGVQNCSFKLEVNVSNEGNTIYVKELNASPISASCFCCFDFSYEIKGMEPGKYVICISGRREFKPLAFTYSTTLNKTYKLEVD